MTQYIETDLVGKALAGGAQGAADGFVLGKQLEAQERDLELAERRARATEAIAAAQQLRLREEHEMRKIAFADEMASRDAERKLALSQLQGESGRGPEIGPPQALMQEPEFAPVLEVADQLSTEALREGLADAQDRFNARVEGEARANLSGRMMAVSENPEAELLPQEVQALQALGELTAQSGALELAEAEKRFENILDGAEKRAARRLEREQAATQWAARSDAFGGDLAATMQSALQRFVLDPGATPADLDRRMAGLIARDPKLGPSIRESVLELEQAAGGLATFGKHLLGPAAPALRSVAGMIAGGGSGSEEEAPQDLSSGVTLGQWADASKVKQGQLARGVARLKRSGESRQRIVEYLAERGVDIDSLDADAVRLINSMVENTEAPQ